MFRRILVGFDGSNGAREALRAGITMAVTAGGEVAVLVVLSPGHGESEEDRKASFEAEAEALRATAEQELRTHRGDSRRFVHVTAGERPAAALSHYAAEHGFDLLVVGRHGRDRAVRRGLGSVARTLAETSPCPLLLVGDGQE
jgi:nucleotide-binding universal stress UspA family protein